MEPDASARCLSVEADARQVRHLGLLADYFKGQIPLKRFRSSYPHYPVLLSDPLIIEPERGSWAVITKFGSVVFWNCSERVRDDLLAEVGCLPGVLDRNEDVRDELEVRLGEKEVNVTFSAVRLRELTLNELKIISLALAQSVALDHFENEVSSVLRKFEPVVNALQTRGKLLLSQREVLKAVGFALAVRSAVLENLTLFDSPPETWESEVLAHLDSQLYDHFDLDERLSAVNQKLGYLTDVHSLLINLLNNRKSQRLEWIIILLIFIEIVFFVFYEWV